MATSPSDPRLRAQHTASLAGGRCSARLPTHCTLFPPKLLNLRVSIGEQGSVACPSNQTAEKPYSSHLFNLTQRFRIFRYITPSDQYYIYSLYL